MCDATGVYYTSSIANSIADAAKPVAWSGHTVVTRSCRVPHWAMMSKAFDFLGLLFEGARGRRDWHTHKGSGMQVAVLGS